MWKVEGGKITTEAETSILKYPIKSDCKLVGGNPSVEFDVEFGDLFQLIIVSIYGNNIAIRGQYEGQIRAWKGGATDADVVTVYASSAYMRSKHYIQSNKKYNIKVEMKGKNLILTIDGKWQYKHMVEGMDKNGFISIRTKYSASFDNIKIVGKVDPYWLKHKLGK